MIPNARKIMVDGKIIYWNIKSGKDRYNLGWTPPVLTLTIQQEKDLSQFILSSTLWTSEHEIAFFDEPSMSSALPHKNTFSSNHVKRIVEHNFSNLNGIKIDNWMVKKK